MRKIYIVPCLCVFLPLGGCLSTLENGPTRLYTDAEQTANLRATVPPWDFSVSPTKDQRNNYVTARMYAIDFGYTAYFTNLTKERQLGTLGSDLAVVGLAAATTVVGGAETKAAIGAVTTAIASARSSVDKDILLSQTVQILQNQMEVSRLSIRGRIYSHLQQDDVSVYTMAQALSDVEDYYRAGTLSGALESLSSTVGGNDQRLKSLVNGITPSGDAPARPNVSPPV